MKINLSFIQGLFLAVLLVPMAANNVYAEEINGTVIAVDEKQVRIKISPDDVPGIGDQVELSFVLADEKFMVGTWRVIKVDGMIVLAETVNAELPADVGMTATITAAGEEELFWLKPKKQASDKPSPAREKPVLSTSEKQASEKRPPVKAAPALSTPVEVDKSAAENVSLPAKATIVHMLTNQYERVWKDSGSGARKDFATFRPQGPPGYYPLGDVAVAEPWPGKRYAKPKFNTVMVSSGQVELKKPEGYRKIWDSAGSHSKRPFSSWEAVAPDGYRCLGDVGSQSLNSPPATDAIRCLPDQCVQETELGDRIWKDKGSGATIDFSAWRIPQLNLYIGTPAHARPRGVIYTINPDCWQ